MTDFIPPESESPPTGQVVPHSREAEEAVLGSILINPESYYDLAQFLQPEDFYIHRHRWIWTAFTRLHEKRVPIDFLTVSEELNQQGQLIEVGGPAFRTALINNVPTSLHAEAYGHLVEETSVRRRMLEAANQIAKLAYQQESSIETVMDEAEKSVFGVSERRITRDLQSIQQVLSDYYDRIDQHGSQQLLPNFWESSCWLPCADGKVRRAPDDSFLLAAGVPDQVCAELAETHRSLLAALGNPIVHQVAAEIVRAMIEAES